MTTNQFSRYEQINFTADLLIPDDEGMDASLRTGLSSSTKHATAELISRIIENGEDPAEATSFANEILNWPEGLHSSDREWERSEENKEYSRGDYL